MSEGDQKDESGLEALFAASRATSPEPPDALMQRVLADAVALQPCVGRGTAWRRWMAALGGAPALSGLITAASVGVWLGLAPPTGVPDLAGEVLGMDDAAQTALEGEILIGFGWDIEEG